MIRKAFRMSVRQGHEREYERRHAPIWPELEDTLLRHGVRNYSIYLDPETLDLFGYAEIESEEEWQRIAHTDVCRQWWRFMKDLMPTNADASPVSRDLREVFHIERPAGTVRGPESGGRDHHGGTRPRRQEPVSQR